MARLVILTKGTPGRAIELGKGRLTIGRAEDNAFQISDPAISTYHCEKRPLRLHFRADDGQGILHFVGNGQQASRPRSVENVRFIFPAVNFNG